MIKDINVLLDTTSPQIFEEQMKLWPGVALIQKFGWECKCGDPNCFMGCIQKLGTLFNSPEKFGEYLERCVSMTSREELQETLYKFALEDKQVEFSLSENLKGFREGLAETRQAKKRMRAFN